MKRLLLAAVATAISASSAYAQTKRIEEPDSIIRLKMPGLEGRKPTYEWFVRNDRDGVPAFEVYHAGAAAAGGLPRGAVQVSDIYPGRKRTTTAEMNEAWVKSFASWFKDKTVSIYQTASAGTQEVDRAIRFTVADADCVAWSTYGGGRMAWVELLPGREVRGFYCGKPGQKLSDVEIAAVRKGYEVKG